MQFKIFDKDLRIYEVKKNNELLAYVYMDNQKIDMYRQSLTFDEIRQINNICSVIDKEAKNETK